MSRGEYNINIDINTALKKHFGFSSLRPGQSKVIDAVLSGHSAAAIFPTGAGKSLCYQLPALMLPNLTLVISPLLALMKDQIEFLQKRGIPSVSIDSTNSEEEKAESIRRIKSGEIKILMISVERLKNERFREFIKTIPISLLVVDEAHCISEWGHNFRPDYIKLPQYQREFAIQQALLLTATATPAVIADMKREFDLEENNITVTGFYRKNLNLQVIPSNEFEKKKALLGLMQSEPRLPAIIYVTLQKTSETIAAFLQSHGIPALAYHAGLKSEVREEIQTQFMQKNDICIVATIAFGMGIDKSNIRSVIHFDLPSSIENYAQEVGRAGRDGEPSDCVLIGCESGRTTLENFIYGDTPECTAIAKVLENMQQSSDKVWEVVLNSLSIETNIRPLPLKTLLVYLELMGIIKPRYSYFGEYKYKNVLSDEDIMDSFQGERRDFIKNLLACGQKARVWTTLDINKFLDTYSTDRNRVVSALDYFQNKGWIILETKQMTEAFEVLNSNFSPRTLAEKLHTDFKAKEEHRISRIDQMLKLFQSNKCLSKQLADYFADKAASDNCGHCSVCMGRFKKWPMPNSNSKVNKELMVAEAKQLSEVISEKFNHSPSIDLVCRYLCGITTPWLTQIKAKSMTGFGSFENIAYRDVYAALLDTRGGY